MSDEALRIGSPITLDRFPPEIPQPDDDEDEEEEEEAARGFTITDHATLFWAMRKASQALAKIRERERLKEAEIDAVLRWFDADTRRYRRTIEFMEPQIIDYVRRRVESGEEDQKSIRTPHGKVSSHQSSPRFVVYDESLIPDDFRYSETVQRIAIPELRKLTHPGEEGEAVLSDGRVIQGVGYETRERSYRIDLVP